jgi:two-component system phosphate regulon sensor histidine kinase PhoR
MVSHELRTPLNSINGFLEIVLEGQVGALNDRQQEFLNYAFVSTQQLMTLVEDILFISKADAGQFKLRRSSVDVALLMEQAVHSALQAAEKVGIPLLADIPTDPIQIRGDELRLLQVLNNLLGNAIKFSLAGTSVRLSASIEGNDIRFAVTDRGKGISSEERERIFDRFYQADSSARSRGEGYGLGLAIAKLIVEQHGGRIWVESKPDDATTFFVSLPLTSPDSAG